MDYANAHNLQHPPPTGADLHFGIRVRLPARDPLQHLLDQGWSKTHWYATARERDDALAEMSRRHPYSRTGDLPNLVFERIER
jgi:hypothetical protein